ncbi:glycosyltransferase family 4 protein [Pantanalinema rosaneae CENA516]|uniref:glycosyltransferase family 4 protein n=1 Tax=Pantanalinema rosaneae TaxID=1620701 RepID=UPI003D6EC2FB
MQSYLKSLITRRSKTKSEDKSAHSNSRIMLFDLYAGGHHPIYIQHLIKYWHEQSLNEQIDILVTPEVSQNHFDCVISNSDIDRQTVNIVTITPKEAKSLVPRTSPINRAFRALQEWILLWKYVRLRGTTHCLVMYFDSFQTPLALGLKLPCRISGIYFRPTFHYTKLPNYQPTRKETIQHWREKIILPRILMHPQLEKLFCLDPLVIKYIFHLDNQAKSIYLPDPIPFLRKINDYQIEQTKKVLGIETGRRIFLLFGAIDKRKGVYQLLQAIERLPKEYCQKLCLILAGQVEIQAEQVHIEAQVAKACKLSNVQIIKLFKFIPDNDMSAYFQLADVILAPYQKHVGMSGIILLAAATSKPVLSSDYGLMGEIVRQNELGLAINSSSPEELEKALLRLLSEPLDNFCNPSKMHTFSQQYSPEKFSSIIFQNLLNSIFNT